VYACVYVWCVCVCVCAGICTLDDKASDLSVSLSLSLSVCVCVCVCVCVACMYSCVVCVVCVWFVYVCVRGVSVVCLCEQESAPWMTSLPTGPCGRTVALTSTRTYTYCGLISRHNILGVQICLRALRTRAQRRQFHDYALGRPCLVALRHRLSCRAPRLPRYTYIYVYIYTTSEVRLWGGYD